LSLIALLDKQVSMRSKLNLPGSSAAPLLSIEQFSLRDIGIETDRFFIDISASFDNLPLDGYEKRRQQVVYLANKFPGHRTVLNKFLPDYFCSKASLDDIGSLISHLTAQERLELEQLGEIRHRAIAKFDVCLERGAMPQIRRISAGGFTQNTLDGSDLRSLPRFFSEVSEQLANHLSFRHLCRYVVLFVKNLNPKARKLTLTVHQVSVCVKRNQPFHLPDGIHQDGVDYIVSAIPVILQDVVTPISTVYDLNEKPLFTTTLKAGEGLFHDDRHYKHSVSPLYATANLGRRCTLGFDFELS